MPKPWEYTPRRYLIMQVVMCLILCGTLGLAYAVSRTMGFPSGEELKVGPISLRLPDGFIPDNNPDVDLQARDSGKRMALLVRILPDLLDDGVLSDAAVPFEFRGLKESGRLSIIKRTVPGPEAEAAKLIFTASARLPGLQQRVVLNLIALEEDPAQQLAVRTILQKVANSVTLTGETAPTHPRDHSKDTEVRNIRELQSFHTRGARI